MSETRTTVSRKNSRLSSDALVDHTDPVDGGHVFVGTDRVDTEWVSSTASVTATCASCGCELAGRRDALHCSSACRQRSYRARRLEEVG